MTDRKRRAGEWLTDLREQHYDKIYRLARHLLSGYGVIDDPEDIVQDVFEEAFRQSDGLSNHPNLAGWLMKTTKYKCRNAQRAGIRESHRVAFSIDNPHAPEVTDRLAERLLTDAVESHYDLGEVIDKLRQQMTEDEYRLYAQLYEQKRSFSELAREYRVSNSAMRTRACRVRQKMMRLLRSILSILVTYCI